MVEEDRYCIDVVTQIAAVLRRVEEGVFREPVAHCVEHAITSGSAAEQRRKVKDLMDVLDDQLIGRSEYCRKNYEAIIPLSSGLKGVQAISKSLVQI